MFGWKSATFLCFSDFVSQFKPAPEDMIIWLYINGLIAASLPSILKALSWERCRNVDDIYSKLLWNFFLRQ